MTTRELIASLALADPTGDLEVMIYVDSDGSFSYHCSKPSRVIAENGEADFRDYVLLPTGDIWMELS